MKTSIYTAIIIGALSVSCHAQFLAGPNSSSAPQAPAFNRDLLKSLLQAQRPELKFQPDDVLSVQVYGLKDYALQQRIAQDGSIALPLIGKVQAADLTAQQLQIQISSLLKEKGMLQDPQVTLTAVSQPSAVVTVSGDVTKPGIFPAYGSLTVMDLISEAGGLVDQLQANSATNSPASSVVTLIRPTLAGPVSIPLGPDPVDAPYARIPVFPGDEIRVGKVGFVYAVGALKAQGAFPLKNSSPTTVLQLVALAGGIGFEADRKDAHIIRAQGNTKYVLSVDVGKILKGKVADIALQPDDILFVPSNDMKAAIKGGGSGLLVSLASAYIYRQ